jgi:thioesterase domain-containing protein
VPQLLTKMEFERHVRRQEPPFGSNTQSKRGEPRRKVFTVLRQNRKSLMILPENAAIASLQPAGDGTPFFMVDSCNYFIDVVKLMGSDHPVLSLIPREEDHIHPSEEYDLHDEADAHLKTILKQQPQGPYVLGGFSTSGIVAYDIAQRLQARGHAVAVLVLFETPNPYFMCEFSPFLNRLACHRADLRRLRWSEVPRWAAKKLRGRIALGLVPRAANVAPSLMDLSGLKTARIVASRKYRPAAFSGRVLLVKRYRGLEGQYLDPQYGWGEVVQGKIEICLVSAIEHLDIFKLEPDREVVARKLRSNITESLGALSIPRSFPGHLYGEQRT